MKKKVVAAAGSAHHASTGSAAGLERYLDSRLALGKAVWRCECSFWGTVSALGGWVAAQA